MIMISIKKVSPRIVYGITLLAIIILLIVVYSSKLKPLKGNEDTAYLTPIPMETLLAYKCSSPIANKLQAVIATHDCLIYLHYKIVGELKVDSVESITLAEAQRRVAQPNDFARDNRPGETEVWFVLFEGDWQPDYSWEPQLTITPNPPTHGCSYVIWGAQINSFSETGSIACGKH